jgi:hypothetical protein
MKNPSSPRAKASPATKPAAASIPPRLEVTRPTALATQKPPAKPGVGAPRHVRFGYFKPEAREVNLVGSFNGWDPRATPMKRDALGDWSVDIELPNGEHRYRFFVDGEWREDPSAQQTTLNPFGGFDAIMVVV